MTKEKKNEDKAINCFVIMPISQQAGYESGHFDLVYEDIVKPAVMDAGMNPVRADETKNTNLIQLDILKKVIESDIAICDMSAKNPNVFYELGVRQAFDKPTVLMIDDTTNAPFDVSSLRYVDYKKTMGYREVKDAVARLTQTLKDTYDKREDKSEINSLIRLMELTTPAQMSQSDITAEDRTAIQISELTAAVHQIQQSQSKLIKTINSDRNSNQNISLLTESDSEIKLLKERISSYGEKINSEKPYKIAIDKDTGSLKLRKD